jgi:branched-chain amino acid transport system ATP-binding protein
MARTFQITTLFPRLTVLDNVLLAVQGLRRMKFVMWRPLLAYRDVYAKARTLLERLGFWERRQVEIRHLSHGEQRQLEIVLALASDPQLLLLDEPVAGLSTGESQEMAQFLQSLDPTLAILMIEHDMDVAFAVVDSITVLHYGEVVEAGSPERIRASARVRDIYLGTP